MRLHLDTNAVIAILKDQPAGVRRRFRNAVRKGTPIAVSAVVVFELWYGVARSGRQRENAERLRTFLAGGVDVLAVDEGDALEAGTLRAQLRESGTPIGPYDLFVAVQAIRRGATLVTANTAEFARVRGLKRQDWTKAA